MKPHLMFTLLVPFLRWIFALLGSFVAGFFGRFLGAEGTAIMTTGRNIVLFAILLWGFIFLFHRYGFRLKHELRLVVYISFLFFLSSFAYFLRTHFLSYFSLWLSTLLPTFLIFKVSSREISPYSSPENSDPTSEDSFGLQVLSEPWPVRLTI